MVQTHSSPHHLEQTPQTTHFQGEVVRVNFRNARNGYAILTCETAPYRHATVVGITRALPGETIHALGTWHHHPRFGRQFVASEIKVTIPNRQDKIKSFLRHLLAGCAGESTINKIIDAYGDRTIEVLDRGSDEIAKIKGIGARKAKRIFHIWRTHRLATQADSVLKRLELPSSFAQICLDKLGKDLHTVIEENPYLLCYFPEIDFTRIDAIAREQGINDDDPRRDRGIVLSMIAKRLQQGHVGTPQYYLDYWAKRLVNSPIAQERLDAALQWCHDACFSLQHNVNIYHREVFLIENDCAETIQARIRDPVRPPTKPIRADATHDSIRLTSEQIAAVTIVNHHPIAVVTGGPGTGKTSVLRALCQGARQAGWRVVFCAPTGKAAKRMTEVTGAPAHTIARLLHPFRHEPLEEDLLVIDEASMVDSFMLQRVLQMTPNTRILIVGDCDQLPPVGPGQPLHDLIQHLPKVVLTTIFRQQGTSPIIDAAQAVIRGMPLTISPSAEFALLHAPTNEKIKNLLDKLIKRFQDVQILAPVRRGEIGITELNRWRQEMRPKQGKNLNIAFGDNVFYCGDPVIHTQNNYELNTMNGDTGIIVDIDQDNSTLTVEYDHGRVVYDELHLEQLELAYALSVHKSQGSQFPCVAIVVSEEHARFWTRKMLYTAITRAQKHCFIIGHRDVVQQIISEQRDRKRLTWLGQAIASTRDSS